MLSKTINNKQDILHIKFDLIAYNAAMAVIDQWRASGRCHYVTITNPHSVMLCHRDKMMGRATQRADMVLPDGAGIIMAANILGYSHNGRATGPNLMLKLCDWGRKKGYRHYFYGGAEGVADKLARRLTEMYPGLQVAGTYCPPFRQLSDAEDRQIVDIINNAQADIVWVGLGAPKQEKWMAEHVDRIKATAMIGVGAAFDFHSGNVKWAPAIIRKLGLEWMWRLLENPRRMWRRNLDSPLFLAKVFMQKLRGRFADKSIPDTSPEKSVEHTPTPRPGGCTIVQGGIAEIPAQARMKAAKVKKEG